MQIKYKIMMSHYRLYSLYSASYLMCAMLLESIWEKNNDDFNLFSPSAKQKMCRSGKINVGGNKLEVWPRQWWESFQNAWKVLIYYVLFFLLCMT